MSTIRDRALAMCDTPPCTYTFDSGWNAMAFDSGVSEDLFFAYRGMTYRVTGTITVGTNGTTSGGYKVTAYKSWNFDKNEELSGVPFEGAAYAAGFGLAREFAVVGTSSYQSW